MGTLIPEASATEPSNDVTSAPRLRRGRLSLAVGLLLLAIFLIPAARPYLQPGYQVAHDRITPFLRVDALVDALAQGQFPPRWFPEFDGGYGSPYPSFYGMSFYYLAVLISSLQLSVGSSVELAAFLVVAVAGIGMFFLVRQLIGTPSALLSAGLYVYAPYHLVDAYVRGAYSELTAFVWFPLIVLCMLEWANTRRKGWIVGGALSLGGLVVTHNIMPMVFLPALPVLALAMIPDLRNLRGDLSLLTGWLAMAVLGCLTSACFWVPVALDRRFIRTDYFLHLNYRDDFVGLSQLLGTTLTHGLTSEIGVPLLVSAAGGLIVIHLSRNHRLVRRLLYASTLVALGYVFLMNHRSALIWAHVPLLPYVQFPWRLLAPASFFLALTAGALTHASRSLLGRWLLAIGVPLFALGIHLPLVAIPKTIDAQSLAALSTCQEVWGTQDYRPVWSNEAFWQSPTPPEASPQAPVLPPCAQQISLEFWRRPDPSSYSVRGRMDRRLHSATARVIRLPVFYYPTWKAEIDGDPTLVTPQALTGLIEIAVPPGTHEIHTSLGRTFSQKLGIVLSLVGLAGVLGLGASRQTPRWLLPASPSHSGA